MARRRSIVPGERIGAYKTVREIGRGGMSSIFEVIDHAGARFAVKVLQAEVEKESVFERFEREGQILYALRHENLARILELGTLDDGRPYQVMELLHGTDLSQRIEEQGMLAIHDICRIVIGACRGTGAAHSCKVIHRDLKPANIFLARNTDGSETVKVLDFGVAKTFGEESLTPLTDIVGSPQYLAPEQLADKRRFLRETDVWALGVVLYRGLTENLPFDAPNLALLCKAILEGTPKSIVDQRPDCPPELERVVLRCLEKDPAKRFPTLDELATALAPFAEKPARSSVRSLPAAAPPSERTIRTSSPSFEGPPSERALRTSSPSFEGPPPSRALQTSSPSFEDPPSDRTIRASSPSLEGPPSERALRVPSSPSFEGPPSERALRTSSPSLEPSVRRFSLSVPDLPPSSSPSLDPPKAATKRRSPLLVAGLVALALAFGGVGGLVLSSLKPAPAAGAAMLRVTTEPPGAFVSIDYGPQLSTAEPIRIVRDGASHVVYVFKDGYRPETRNMTFSGDLALDLALVPAGTK